MAKFTVNGMDDLTGALDQLARLDRDTVFSILDAGASVYVEAFKRKISELFTERTGGLIGSIRAFHRVKENPVVLIYPAGAHPRQGKTIDRKYRTQTGGSKPPSASEVGYILEYGSPRIGATHWMETAAEEAHGDAVAAMQAAWDEHVSSLGL